MTKSVFYTTGNPFWKLWYVCVRKCARAAPVVVVVVVHAVGRRPESATTAGSLKRVRLRVLGLSIVVVVTNMVINSYVFVCIKV